MTNKTDQRPGTRLLSTGLVAIALGLVLLILNLTNSVTRYVDGEGLIETRGPSAAAIVLIAAGLLLAAIGFGRRILAAVEKD